MKSRLIAYIEARWEETRRSSLLMNALFLMISTLVLGLTGFVFWAIVTRVYDASAVGLATTLLSLSGLLSLLGLAGFDTTFVRFLPKSDRKNDYINTGFIVAASVSAALAVGVAAVLPLLSPSLSILWEPWAFVSFVLFTIVASLSTLVSSVFLAFKQARYVLVITAIFCILKVVLPLVATSGGAIAIFSIAGVSQLVGLALGILWMRRRFEYRISPIVHMDTLRVVRKFSASIYVSNVLSLLSSTLLPLVVLHYLGAKSAAYYYMAFTIANMLYTIVYGTMQSVLAEGSHDESAMRSHVATAAKLIFVLLVPAIIVTVFLGKSVLAIFGAEYASGAGDLLQLLALAALPTAVYVALTTTFKVAKNLRPVIGMNAVCVVIVLALSNWWIPIYGLISIGWACIIGNLVACCIGIFLMIKIKNKGGDKYG
jgi:O-antigen/teichoic acid export membrane protein